MGWIRASEIKSIHLQPRCCRKIGRDQYWFTAHYDHSIDGYVQNIDGVFRNRIPVEKIEYLDEEQPSTDGISIWSTGEEDDIWSDLLHDAFNGMCSTEELKAKYKVSRLGQLSTESPDDADAAKEAPDFDGLVKLIEKNFKDFIESTNMFTAEEVEQGWQRYKTLNHLYK